jgi:hypothetical protein
MSLRKQAKGRPNCSLAAILRELEYFSAILTLTTNRIETMDGAFQSRIQLAGRIQGSRN